MVINYNVTGAERKTQNKDMKTITLLAVAIGVFSALPLTAQTVVKTTTVTSRGTVSTYEPGTSFVVTETSGPVTYHYGPTVVYRTSSGVVIPEAEVCVLKLCRCPVRTRSTPAAS